MSVNKLLVFCLEKPDDFPYYPPIEIARSLAERDFGPRVDVHVEVLPRHQEEAPQTALEWVRKTEPTHIIVLTFEALQMEIVLYRYLSNTGSLPEAPEVLISSAEFLKLFSFWQKRKEKSLAHVLVGIHPNTDFENDLAFQLHHLCFPQVGQIGLMGIPPFAEEHEFLRPVVLEESVFRLLSELASSR